MSPISTHRDLLHLQAWLASSCALRKRLRLQLLASVSPKRSRPLFQELLLEWDDSSC